MAGTLQMKLQLPPITAEEESQARAKAEEEEDAKSRAVYDPLKKTFDPRKRRVTDLVECDRVTLPKPLLLKRHK